MYEFIIVGAGPAGMTAAVYAARKKLKTLLVSKDVGGQLLLTKGIENYMGYQYIEGPELMEKFETQVKLHPIEMEIGYEVTRVVKKKDVFQVQTHKGPVWESLALIVASGKRSRPLDVPGEKDLVGRGVSYCATCDGPFFQGEKVAVIGGGNSALQAVEDMTRIAEHIYMVSIGDLTGDRVIIEKVKQASNVTILTGHRVVEIAGKSRVEGVVVKPLLGGDARTLGVAGVFVEIGLIPNSGLVSDLVDLNEFGEIMVNPLCETSVPGLFAAGDVTDVAEKQIVVAAGEGSKAALQAHKYLQKLGVPTPPDEY